MDLKRASELLDFLKATSTTERKFIRHILHETAVGRTTMKEEKFEAIEPIRLRTKQTRYKRNWKKVAVGKRNDFIAQTERINKILVDRGSATKDEVMLEAKIRNLKHTSRGAIENALRYLVNHKPKVRVKLEGKSRLFYVQSDKF